MNPLKHALDRLERQLMVADEAVTIAATRLDSGEPAAVALDILRIVALVRAADHTVGALLRAMLSTTQESTIP